ncbi:heat shock transcription factor, Y-linked-like [Latimeria chalumnae]|uniref:HSF-type DNA-binding domain-containing protein n=1 Tax=Latimeria chalumnae TaxID=7897 RepID=H3AWV2_LATCH|nr:PREDICTED: heat shock transcription factor, Y-linked-like [Latimeria chalumnae]|eukprot:XP_005991895.1 PREDICTED: heat shock transcription factor, Y-linked-like [Latimeria chalumnae]
MATVEKIIKVENDVFEAEPDSSATPSTSSRMEIAESSEKSINSILSSVSSMCDQTAAGDSELRSLLEENALRALTEGSVLKRPRFSYYDGLVAESDFLSLTFPKKLWKIVDSDQFRSIRWDEDGDCVVIDEEFFKKEVLERKGPFRIFETDCMKSFIRQLNLYGFSKIRQDYQRSASLAEFLVEEKAATALTKLQFYHNPNFRRDYPHLLVRMKRRVGIKSAVPISCPPEEESSSSSLPSAGTSATPKYTSTVNSNSQQIELPSWPANETAQKSVDEKPTTTQRPTNAVHRTGSGYSAMPGTAVRSTEHSSVDHSTKTSQLTHFYPPQHSGSKRANNHAIDSTTTTSATSVYNFLPAVPGAGFGPMMGLPGFQTMYPDLTAMQAHLATLIPFCNPWLSMPMMAAASAISMSGTSHHHRTPAHHHHCPNCNCSSSSVPSSRSGTRNTEYMGSHR